MIPVFTAKMGRYIRQRDKGLCVYCGKYGEEIDHVVPLAEHGPTIRGNLVLACRTCNGKKSFLLNEPMMTMAFRHLLEMGESLDWTESMFEKGNVPSEIDPEIIWP